MYSICMATMNASVTLGRAIDSILIQDTDDYEIIVSDGGSTDGTLEMIGRYGEKIHCISEPDSGIADAWNKAVRRSRGKWLYFLGADDMLASSHVLSDVAVRLEQIDSLIAYGDVLCVNASGREVSRLAPEWDADSFRRCGMIFSHQGVFHHRKLFESYGAFSSKFSIALDYEFLLRYLKDNDAIHMADIIVAHAQLGGKSTKDVNMLDAFLENRLAQRMHGIQRNSITFYRALAGAILKRGIVRLVGEKWGGQWIEAIRPMVWRPRRG
jgi:glycosyltransferase involved in cell wall biosynthesis